MLAKIVVPFIHFAFFTTVNLRKNPLSLHAHYTHFFANIMELLADDNILFVDDKPLLRIYFSSWFTTCLFWLV